MLNFYKTQHISGWDNLSELAKLEGETITGVYFIMPGETYEYDFDGIFVKPFYSVSSYSATRADAVLTLEEADLSVLENARLTVTYTVGSGKNAEKTILYNDAAAKTVTLDLSGVEAAENKAGSYTAVVSSDNYADITVTINASEEQLAALAGLIEQAKTVLAGNPENSEALSTNISSAEAALAEAGSSASIASVMNTLDSLINAASGNGGSEQHH